MELARDRTFAFDEFGPLTIKSMGGSAWAPQRRPQRLRANYNKPHGSRQLFGAYSIGDDHLWGSIEPVKGAAPTLRHCSRSAPAWMTGEPIYMILDNLNHHRGKTVRDWCEANAVKLMFTPTYASWANPIEAHFGPLRQFVLANSDHADQPALGRVIRAHLHWRNTHTRDPDLLEAERRHRARFRSEQQRRWGHSRRAV